MDVYILKNGIVVQPEDWTNIKLSITTGMLNSFTRTSTNVEYIHVSKSQFRTKDAKILSAGYYPKYEFLKYLVTGEINLIKSTNKYGVAYGFINAVSGVDTINLKVLAEVSNEGALYPYFKKYTLTYDSSVNYRKASNRTPSNLTPVPVSLNTDNTTAFINSNITTITESLALNDSEKVEAVRLLGRTAVLIKMIVENIFSLFPNEATYTQLINYQKDVWDSQVFTNTATVNDYKAYYISLLGFYKASRRNTYNINQASSEDKLFWVAISMTVKAIAQFTLELRKTLLTYLIEKKLSKYFEKEEEEKFTLRIIESFAYEPTSQSDRDSFLEWLISKKQENFLGEITLYEVLYGQMSTSWNITETFITFSNWVMETDFVPTNTKGAYVQILYALWQNSKYNPYNELNNIKDNTIGLISLSNKAEFTQQPATNTEGYLYNYTLETGYETFPSSEDTSCANWSQFCTLKRFYRQTPYALQTAPLSIPYESEKIGGIFSDNFTFEFYGEKIKAYQESLPVGYYPPKDANNDGEPDDENDEGNIVKRSLLFGVYDIYQPVTLINTDIDSKHPILTTKGNETQIGEETINSFVPVFVLKYIDDSGDRSDDQKIAGYVVDGVLTLSGIGNLAKLRHLRWFGGTSGLISMNFARALVGGVEFTASILTFLSNFVECNNNKTCENIKSALVIIELACGGLDIADTIATRALKKQTRKTFEDAGGGTNEAERKLNLKNKILEANPSAPVDKVDETVDKFYDLAKYGDLVEEFFEFTRTLNNLGYNNFRTKLLQLNTTNSDLATKFVAFLKRDENVYKLLDENPSFLDDITDSVGVKKIADTIYILSTTKEKLLKRIQSFEPKRFNNFHSDRDLKSIVEDALDLELTTKELDDFVYISCRTGPPPPDKRIVSSELREQMSYWRSTIKQQGYPSKFFSIEAYNIFSQRLKTLMKSYNLPSERVFIQGSSLRKVNSDDVDVAVFLTSTELNTFLRYQEDVWKVRKMKGTNRLSKSNSKFSKYQRSIEQAKEKGIIKPNWWKNNKGETINVKAGLPDTFEDVSHLFEGVSDYSSNKLNLSIIITDGAFDVSPYLKVN